MRGWTGLLRPVTSVGGGHGGALEPNDGGALEPEEQAHESAPESGWRGFLRSWKLAAILVVGCIVGLLAIFSANPSQPRVSDSLSEKLGSSAACTKVGEAAVAGEATTVYRCTVTTSTKSTTQCFVVADGEVRQFAGARELRC
jgi:hypothetical protein